MAGWEQVWLAVGSVPEREWPEERFRALFHEHYPAIVAVVARMVGERSLAEEIADDAFWRLYRRPQLAADGHNIPGWLYRTSTRLALDALRARRRGWNRRERVACDHLVTDDDSPLGAFERGEQVARVRAALARLRPAQAQILVLRHQGLSYLDLAAALDMKPSSVGTTLARAERAFARAYHQEVEA